MIETTDIIFWGDWGGGGLTRQSCYVGPQGPAADCMTTEHRQTLVEAQHGGGLREASGSTCRKATSWSYGGSPAALLAQLLWKPGSATNDEEMFGSYRARCKCSVSRGQLD